MLANLNVFVISALFLNKTFFLKIKQKKYLNKFIFSCVTYSYYYIWTLQRQIIMTLILDF